MAANEAVTFLADTSAMSVATLALSGPDAAHDDQRDIAALSAQAASVIAVARTLVESERAVDLQGLQQHVGVLCAKALDLPPGQAGFAKLELRRLVTGLDALERAMRDDPA